MSRIFITGSADGLGRAAAETLLGEGHQVIVHAREPGRLHGVRVIDLFCSNCILKPCIHS
ncbi:short chain dehydrogenase [Serratia plymuthica]|uniref:hypothetical protein n=1 Tax=Serratia plymuthica TaxID=82996 RepID=UPI002178B768|nr:short chain dehydrogenase [Serratia plymuthica]